QLKAQIDGGNEAAAVEAVRQMALMVDPPLESLVDAATSTNQRVGREAKARLDALVDDWQQRVDNGHLSPRETSNLELLAAALDRDRKSFATSDYAWLATATRKIVRIANKNTVADATPEIAVHCESLLALTGTARAVNPSTKASLPSSQPLAANSQ